jgi:endonuclease YncB( thermonuclease family)
MRVKNILPFRRRRARRNFWPAQRAGRAGRRLSAAIWIVIFAAVAVASGAHQEIYARVAGLIEPGRGCALVGVVDGDTVRAYYPAAGTVSVRLLGFDTPEVFGPSCAREMIRGTRATWTLRWRILTASEVRFVLAGTDRYGRRLGTMFIDGENVAAGMIADGLARAYDGGKRSGWCGAAPARGRLPQI